MYVMVTVTQGDVRLRKNYGGLTLGLWSITPSAYGTLPDATASVLKTVGCDPPLFTTKRLHSTAQFLFAIHPAADLGERPRKPRTLGPGKVVKRYGAGFLQTAKHERHIIVILIYAKLPSLQSKNATEAIALERFSVFISTRCHPSSRIVAWSGCQTFPRT